MIPGDDKQERKLRKGDLFVWDDRDIGIVIDICYTLNVGVEITVLFATCFDVYDMWQIKSSSKIVARKHE